LGGGGDDGNASAQSLADKKLAGQDPLRGLARAHTDSEVSEDFRLRRLHQGLGSAPSSSATWREPRHTGSSTR
jgi:hypothetical protein